MTTVILDGALGKKFGDKWELYVDSPAEALRMIECNKPGLINWIRDNLDTYEGYQVTCERGNGSSQTIGEEEMAMTGELVSIRFTPVVTGSGNTAKIIAGVVIIAIAAYFTGGAALTAAGGLLGGGVATTAAMFGAGLVLSGVVGLMTSQQKFNGLDSAARSDKTSYYFNGPINTTAQGVPVQLIYGERCLVGSHVASASITVDEEFA